MVDDEIVIDLVEKEISEYEKKSQSWIMQGFPRTRVQALSLQSMKIIPDRIINLEISRPVSTAHIKQKLTEQSAETYYGDIANEAAERIYNEFAINMRSIEDVFSKFMFTYNCDGRSQSEV